jgi:hypothetical protein
MRNSRGGRPFKGPRELLATRTPGPLADAVRSKAEALGLTVSDYIATLLAQDTNLPQLAPQPVPAHYSAGRRARQHPMELPIDQVA